MDIKPCSTDREIFHALLDKLLDAQKEDPEKTTTFFETFTTDGVISERRRFRLSATAWKEIELVPGKIEKP